MSQSRRTTSKLNRVSLAVLVSAALTSPVALPLEASQSAGDQGAASNQQTTGHSSEPASKKPIKLQTITVVGNLALPRSQTASLAPVDVITPQELQNTGTANLAVALRTLLPSLNFTQPSVADGSDSVQFAQLRGLPPSDTLVLINGKVAHESALPNAEGGINGYGSTGVDFNAIPMNAVERIEVLRDGAAAQYGSAAIAGVVNIVLKNTPRHGSVSVRHGVYDTGDGSTWQGSADGGIPLGNSGSVHLSVNSVYQHPTNRAGPDGRFPGDPTFGQVNFHFGLPLMRSQQAVMNASYRFNDRVEFYAFSVFNKRNEQAGGFFRAPGQYVNDVPAAALVYPNGFLPDESSHTRDDQEVIGAKGEVAGWHYDVSANTGSNHWKFFVFNTFNYSMGSDSPTGFYIGTLANRDKILNLDFRKSFDPQWMKGPLGVAWGIQYEHQGFSIKHGDAASFFDGGPQGFGGFTPADAASHSRHSNAVYVDVGGNVTSAFSLDAAARREKYSDFGSAFVWKLSGRSELSERLALRGTVSTGFRAPSLSQEFFSSSTPQIVQLPSGEVVLQTVATFPATSAPALALGSQPLRAEKSRNYSLGLVYTADSGFYGTLDVYQIRLKHAITLSGQLVGDDVAAYLQSVGLPNVGGGNFFMNALTLRSRGVEAIGAYPMTLRSGAGLTITGGASYSEVHILSIAPNPPQLGLNGLVLPIIDRSTIALTEDGVPRWKAMVGAQWKQGPWSVNGQLTRYGRITNRTDVVTPTSFDQVFSPKYLLDLSASYEFARDWSVTLGANNVTNVYPDRALGDANVNGNEPYNMDSPFGFSGAFYYGSIRYKW